LPDKIAELLQGFVGAWESSQLQASAFGQPGPSFSWRTDALLEEYRRAVNPLSAEMYRLEWAVTK